MTYEEFCKVELSDILEEIETGRRGRVVFIDCGESLDDSEIHVRDLETGKLLSIFPEDY